MTQAMLDGIGWTLREKVARAVCLLRENEPPEGWYIAFSGGKDSIVIHHLAVLAGVKFDAWYNNTTIDPPELVRFIRQHYAHVRWNQPKHNLLWTVAQRESSPPTRLARWCCRDYKEGYGNDRATVIGVRAAESPRRRHAWREVTPNRNGRTSILCLIIHWSDDDVWAFIREHKLPYPSLYDEGFTRLGCIGCPLAGPAGQDQMFARWPRYEVLWKRAVIANWEHNRVTPRRDGKPRFQAAFATGEEFWDWWRSGERRPGEPGNAKLYDSCQSEILFTNADDDAR